MGLASNFVEIDEEVPAHADEAPEIDAGGAALPVSKVNGDIFPSEVGIALQGEREGDVLHVEIGGDF